MNTSSHNTTFTSPDGGLTLICSCCQRETKLRVPASHAKGCPVDVPVRKLSPAERKVVALLFDLKTTKEICNELGLARYTIETHKTHIFRKLNVRSVMELIKLLLTDPQSCEELKNATRAATAGN